MKLFEYVWSQQVTVIREKFKDFSNHTVRKNAGEIDPAELRE